MQMCEELSREWYKQLLRYQKKIIFPEAGLELKALRSLWDSHLKYV